MEIRDLSTFLDYLTSVHKRTRRVIECIPEKDVEWSPAPGKFSFGDIVRHLAGIERWMYAETVQGRPSQYRNHGRELADGLGNVIAYYDKLHDDSKAIGFLLDVLDGSYVRIEDLKDEIEEAYTALDYPVFESSRIIAKHDAADNLADNNAQTLADTKNDQNQT